ncbi:MAG: hypothetical protein ACPG52_08465 [Cognaticolwellia sp.]
MQLFKSLFCWQGFDNRIRFIVISTCCLLAFIIFNESFNNKATTIIALLFFSTISLATTQRRLNDAQLHKNWIFAPAGSFLIAGLIIIFIDHGASYWLLFVPLLLTLLLLTYAGKHQKYYILGYNGPVSLSDFQQTANSSARNKQRVEPTMHAVNASHASSAQNNVYASASRDEHLHVGDRNQRSNHTDIGETIRLALFSHKNARLTIASICALLLLALLMSLLFSDTSPAETPQAQSQDVAQQVPQYSQKVTLADNFSLMRSANNNMVIQWQTDDSDNSEVWSLATAIGDRACENIAFFNGEKIRTYLVRTLDSDYYAYFSPLDSQALIKNIAFKNKFSLCGFNFSLKGSQAALGKSPFYADFIEY